MRSRMKIAWKYIGCSAQSVPSLSNTAMRSTGGTKSGDPSFVTFSTKAIMALFFHGVVPRLEWFSIGERGREGMKTVLWPLSCFSIMLQGLSWGSGEVLVRTVGWRAETRKLDARAWPSHRVEADFGP